VEPGIEWWDTRAGVEAIALEEWKWFCGRVDYYARSLLTLVSATVESDGRAAAFALVERFAQGADLLPFQYLPYQRGRAAACAYHSLGDLPRAADELRRSLHLHYCSQSSCLFAAGALVHLHLESGSLLLAVVTAHAARQRGWWLPMSCGDQLLGPDHIPALLSFLRDDTAGGAVDPALVAALDRARIDPELLDQALDVAATRLCPG